MKITISIICLLVGSSNVFGQKNDLKWSKLFNAKDLSGWDTYLGPKLDSAGIRISQIPVGLNKDPMKVFTVVSLDGENVIRISGENWGGISTQQEFTNYHLRLQFKWGQLTWGKKKNQKKDSGLLYHAVGEQGANNGPWMKSQEFQIEESNTGDYWGVAGAMQDIPAVKQDKNYIYSPLASLTTFSATSTAGRHCIKGMEAEFPSGEWNTLDLYCFEGQSIHIVNGKPVMRLFNSRQMENGGIASLIKGKIQLQSEGAEVFYRRIELQKIRKLPVKFKK